MERRASFAGKLALVVGRCVRPPAAILAINPLVPAFYRSVPAGEG
jgi:hypothetical protein